MHVSFDLEQYLYPFLFGRIISVKLRGYFSISDSLLRDYF